MDCSDFGKMRRVRSAIFFLTIEFFFIVPLEVEILLRIDFFPN